MYATLFKPHPLGPSYPKLDSCIFKENRQNKYRRNFLTQRVCSCWNKLPSNVVGAGTLNEFKSRRNALFAISPFLYDHRATWDSREGLDAGTAGSCSAVHRSSSH